MRISIVNSYFPPWRGGAETYVYNLARALSERGHAVTVLCADDPLPAGQYRMRNFTVRRLPLLGRLYGTPLLPTLITELFAEDADVFHANFPSPYIAFHVAVSSFFRRERAVLTWHNDLPPVTSGARFLVEIHDRLILPHYLRAYARVIATSKTYAETSPILRRIREQVAVVENGVDCERFNPSVDASSLKQTLSLDGKFLLLFVGALTKWHTYKGLETLLRALKVSHEHELDLALVVVGEGQLREHYSMIAHQLGLRDAVTFVGDIPDDSLPSYYAMADALVLPSRDMSEGFGLTLLEANASGKPAIASNVGGVPSVVRDGHNGLLVPPNQPHELAKAILYLRRHPREMRQMGRNGRALAEAHDWRLVASKMERIYEQTISHV